MRNLHRILLFCMVALAAIQLDAQEALPPQTDLRLTIEAHQLIATYCFGCHDESSKEGGLDLSRALKKDGFDGTLVFENLMTAKMPPKDAEQPMAAEKRLILNWLSKHPDESSPVSYRRISRYEFIHSFNDLLTRFKRICLSVV